MDTNTTQTHGEAASVVNPVDDIASLLMGGDEPEAEEEQETEEGTPEEESTEASPSDEPQSEGELEEGEDLTWSKALGVEDDLLQLDEQGNLQGLKVKVDGEESIVGVKELLEGYRYNKHNTQKSQALAEEKKQFESIKADASAKLYEKLSAADKLLGYMEQALTSEFQNIDWNQLRASNPGEYAAMVADFQARKGQIDKIKAGIMEEGQMMTAEQQAAQQQQYQAYLNDQFQQVLKNNPDWSNPEKMKADVAALGDFVQSAYNIPAEVFASVNDARYIEILKDAMAYRKGKTVTEKKLQNVPKFQKAAGKPTKPMSKVTQLTLNARKATGVKQREFQRDAVAELLMGNG
jgi:hypothetical protein